MCFGPPTCVQVPYFPPLQSPDADFPPQRLHALIGAVAGLQAGSSEGEALDIDIHQVRRGGCLHEGGGGAGPG